MCAAKAGEFYLYTSALFMKSFEVENYVVLCYQLCTTNVNFCFSNLAAMQGCGILFKVFIALHNGYKFPFHYCSRRQSYLKCYKTKKMIML